MTKREIVTIVGAFIGIIIISGIFLGASKRIDNIGGSMERAVYSTASASSTSITTTKTLVIATSTSPDVLVYGEFINQGSVPVYICPFIATCTTSNGMYLATGGSMTIEDANPWQGSVYAITASDSATLSIYTMK